MGWRKIRERRAREGVRWNPWVLAGSVVALVGVLVPLMAGEQDDDTALLALFVGACLVVYGTRIFGRHSALIIASVAMGAGALHALEPRFAKYGLVGGLILCIGVMRWRLGRLAREEPTMPGSIARSKRKTRARFLRWTQGRKEKSRSK